ncbi:MAG: PrpF domain-containing protein [Dehalococcoidia bacterium]
MPQRRIRAVFMRGGTSRALVFHAADLPADPADRDRIFCAALSGPAYGRQLNGVGGGISSLSKVAIIRAGHGRRPRRGLHLQPGRDQLAATIDYKGNCGNISSLVSPFAIDEGLVAAVEPLTTVTVSATPTRTRPSSPTCQSRTARRRCRVTMPSRAWRARASPPRLRRGRGGDRAAAPTGRPVDAAAGVPVSLVDATNPTVFVRAADLGMTGVESPDAIDDDAGLSRRLEEIRVAGAELMGIGGTSSKIAVVASPRSFTALSGEAVAAGAVDIVGG